MTFERVLHWAFTVGILIGVMLTNIFVIGDAITELRSRIEVLEHVKR